MMFATEISTDLDSGRRPELKSVEISDANIIDSLREMKVHFSKVGFRLVRQNATCMYALFTE